MYTDGMCSKTQICSKIHSINNQSIFIEFISQIIVREVNVPLKSFYELEY